MRCALVAAVAALTVHVMLASTPGRVVLGVAVWLAATRGVCRWLGGCGRRRDEGDRAAMAPYFQRERR